MDDSIQTLKDEMNKLMSVYDHVKFNPEKNEDGKRNLEPPIRNPEKPLTPLITEAGQSVLEVVGDEAVIRFKDFGSLPVVEATASATLQLVGNKSIEVADSEYNSELGVYHENEISGMHIFVICSFMHKLSIKFVNFIFIFVLGQQTLSPKPVKKSFKNKRQSVYAFLFALHISKQK